MIVHGTMRGETRWDLFVKVQRKRSADGTGVLYASVVENSGVGGKVTWQGVVRANGTYPARRQYLPQD